MVDVRAFKGLIYNPQTNGDLSKVTAPPYDVISPAQLAEYEEMHPHNVVRLILSREQDTDTANDNKYTRANEVLNKWLGEKVLIEDESAAFYVYEQQFTSNGHSHNRLGFITRVKIEDFSSGVILPHEKTYASPRTDRQNLLRTAAANFSQVFALYPDPQNQIDEVLLSVTKEPPLFDFSSPDGLGHRVWRLTDVQKIDQIQKCLKDNNIFIADGHHRYESSLNYRDEMRKKTPEYTGEEPFNFNMMMLVSMSNPGLIIMPTHRLISGVENFTTEKFLKVIEPYFEAKVINFTPQDKLTTLKAIEEKIKRLQDNNHVFCLYTGNEFIFMRLLDTSPVLDQVDEPRTPAWKQLDVTILHHFIMKKLMKYTPGPNQIKYTPRAEELVEKVDNQECQMGFLVAPTKIEQVREIASLHEIMPQKSTYFYPKILTGLVINKHT